MIYADENGTVVCNEYTPVGVKKDPEELAKELFSVLDASAAEVKHHATNEKEFMESVLLPLLMKIQSMLNDSMSYMLLGKVASEKAHEVYDRLSGKA